MANKISRYTLLIARVALTLQGNSANNMAKELKDLTKRSVDYSKWYNELVVKADLAEQADVRGCMVIRPYGYRVWELIQENIGAYCYIRVSAVLTAANTAITNLGSSNHSSSKINIH